jgi:hypothetical protein
MPNTACAGRDQPHGVINFWARTTATNMPITLSQISAAHTKPAVAGNPIKGRGKLEVSAEPLLSMSRSSLEKTRHAKT